MTFILPKSDDCFKELFRNEDVRKYFISDVTGIPLKDIKSIKLANPFEYYVAAGPPVRRGESHPSGQTEPPCY